MFARLLIALAFTLGIAHFLHAQPAPAPADHVKAIEPFITEGTVYLARADISAVDLDAIEKLIMDKLPLFLDGSELADASRDVRASLVFARMLKSELQSSKVSTAYGMVDIRFGPYAVIPAATKAAELRERLQEVIGTAVDVETAHDAVFICPKNRAGRLLSRTPQRRDDLVAALNTGKLPISVALAFSQMLRDQVSPDKKLPQELGGAPLAPLIESHQWALLEIQPPPQISVRATAQMKDQDGMAMLVDMIDAFVKYSRERLNLDFTAAQEAIGPIPDQNRLYGEMNTQQIDALVTKLGATFKAGNATRLQVYSSNNIRQMLLAMQMRGNELRGSFPDSLDELKPYFSNREADRIFVNPAQSNRRPGYIYIKPPANTRTTGLPKMLVLYEAFDQWPGKLNVGYADGRVELITDEARFNRELAAAKGQQSK